ncbi:MAG: hypothetical protein QXZ70_06685 [Candidatus Bathyarchaeia archaeon]
MKKKRNRASRKAASLNKRAKPKASVKSPSVTNTFKQNGSPPVEVAKNTRQAVQDYEWKPHFILPPSRFNYQLQLQKPNFCLHLDIDRIPEEKRVSNEYMEILLHKMRERENFRVINDPLAYYIPYSDLNIGSQQDDSYWGIYFKVKEMNLCFQNFLCFFRASVNLDVDALWNLFVEFVFWHELAHHVLQDLRTLKGDDQAATWRQYRADKSKEEGFCEFFAFKTAEEAYVIPRNAELVILKDIKDHSLNGVLRRIALEYLYYHLNRQSDPVYKPKVDSQMMIEYAPLWSDLWCSHKDGNDILKVPTEVYEKIRYVL